MTSTLVDKNTDHDKPHFDFFFYSNMNVKINNFFQSASWIDASSVVWTLIDNGKLANQIARLAAIVVKINFLSGKSWLHRVYSAIEVSYIKKWNCFTQVPFKTMETTFLNARYPKHFIFHKNERLCKIWCKAVLTEETRQVTCFCTKPTDPIMSFLKEKKNLLHRWWQVRFRNNFIRVLAKF